MSGVYDLVTRAIAGTIGLVSPYYATQYLVRHHQLRAYSAAKTTGSGQSWRPTQGTSAHKEIMAASKLVTGKMRELERNNSHVAGLVRKTVQSVVGSGCWPKAKILKADGTLDDALAKDIDTRYTKWEAHAGANGDDFATIQRMAVRHFMLDGEVLIHRIARPGQPLALEALESDYLDVSKDTYTDKIRIAGGIELDRYGKPVAYWLFQAHPSDRQTDSIRVPAEDILHIFDRQRASQVRGISPLTSIVCDLHDMQEFVASTLVVARVATGFGVMITTPYPEGWMPPGTATYGEDGITQEEYVNPGAITRLRPGETVNTVKPEQPANTFTPFTQNLLKSAAVGAGVAYETLSGDYSQTNYSSSRLARLQEQAFFKFLCDLLDAMLNVPVYKWWLDIEHRLNGLKLPKYEKDPTPYQAVVYSHPPQPWVDPRNDATAAQTRLQMGLETLTQLAENDGRDIEEVFATRAYEIKRMKELGIFGIDPTVEATEAKTESESESVTVSKEAGAGAETIDIDMEAESGNRTTEENT
jgi:lambda family phage portal protein